MNPQTKTPENETPESQNPETSITKTLLKLVNERTKPLYGIQLPNNSRFCYTLNIKGEGEDICVPLKQFFTHQLGIFEAFFNAEGARESFACFIDVKDWFSARGIAVQIGSMTRLGVLRLVVLKYLHV